VGEAAVGGGIKHEKKKGDQWENNVKKKAEGMAKAIFGMAVMTLSGRHQVGKGGAGVNR